MNGYDQHSTTFRRPGRTTIAEAAATKRSDGQSSQSRDGANRYDTSTPEGRRKALAAARRSDNPADEARVRRQINQEANSTIDALMLGLNMDGRPVARRDNRATRRGGYRTPTTVAEVEKTAEECGIDPFTAGFMMGRSSGDMGHDDMDHDGPPMRGRVAESVLNPQIRFRETVNWNGMEEATGDKNLPPWLRDDEDDDDDDMDEAELTTKRRNELPSRDFAGSDRSYPIDTPARARAAIARVKANGSPELQRRVIAAVKRRYPDMDVEATASK